MLRPLPTSSSSLWCLRCPCDKPPCVQSRWVPCPVSPLSACPCPVCCCSSCCCCCYSPTFLPVFGLVLLLQPVWLSVSLYAGWLHLQDCLASLFALPGSLNLTLQQMCMVPSAVLWMNNSPTFFGWTSGWSARYDWIKLMLCIICFRYICIASTSPGDIVILEFISGLINPKRYAWNRVLKSTEVCFL